MKAKNYVYVPFKKRECSEQFLNDIDYCIANARENNVLNAGYHFISFGHERLSHLPANSKIYVIGYGIEKTKPLPLKDQEPAISGGSRTITINTLADRMVYDGLLQSDMLSIKLWFSDHQNNASHIAQIFKDNLKRRDITNRYFIDYYPNSILHLPLIQPDETRKWANNVHTHEKSRASDVRASLFFNTESERLLEKESVQIMRPT